MENMKFRGRVKGGRKWVFGNGIAMNETFAAIVVEYLKDGSLRTVDVEKETIGQYAGIKDDDENKIYGGDIGSFVLHDFRGDAETRVCAVRWDEERLAWMLDDGRETLAYLGDDSAVGSIRLIGDIHNNPELLEEACGE